MNAGNQSRHVKITIDLNDTVCALLAVLDEEGKVENVLRDLADHAQQGVYRPGSWERPWLTMAFGEEWTSKLEPGDPYGRHDCDALFCRPKQGKRKN